MSNHDPVTGPLSREEFAALVRAPHGEAAAVIRRHDPLYGRAAGETLEWRVEVQADTTMSGHFYIEAASEDAAKELAESYSPNSIEWDYDCCEGFDVISVEPRPPRQSK